MLKTGIFVTGTDTGVGKTHVAALFCAALKKTQKICYYKPVQTGVDLDKGGDDDDTRTVVKAAGLTASEWREPTYRLRAPLSPDRAAQREGVTLSILQIEKDFAAMGERFYIVEGAGGLEVPITESLRMSGLIKRLGLPVILVASTRLGTINHTLLSLQHARTLGLNVLGVVLNGPEDPGLADVLVREGVPLLFELPPCETDADVDKSLKIVEKFLASGGLQTQTAPDIRRLDQAHVWHPFTQHGFAEEFPQVVSGEGAWLTLDTGEKILDAISSWWVNIHGHGHPQLAGAMARQAHQLEHVIFSGYTHAPATLLSQKLLQALQVVNPKWSKVFFSDNGSTAVEVALKMAYQYQVQKGEAGRRRFLALRGSYHGDTLAAMSVSEREGFHQVFTPLMATVDFLEPDNFVQLEEKKSMLSDYAAFIFEPLVQGAGGMKFYSAEYLQKACQLMQSAGVLTIADEIFTGFYRTGSMWACEQAQVSPDLICLSKGLTGGYLPLSVTVATNEIFNKFQAPDMDKAFLHGHSYTANPIACAVALASLELLQKPQVQHNIRQLSEWTRYEITHLQELPGVFNARSLGTIGAFEATGSSSYFKNGEFSRLFAKKCEEQGALIRPLGSTVYTVPPYCVTKEEMQLIYKAIRETIFCIQKDTL
jgi:adenosylmethionine---8-amino-7-oxononanoate aminotransferase